MLNIIINKVKYEMYKRCPRILKIYNYKICDKLYGIPQVNSIDKTLDKLLSGRVSMSRFGDGEFDVMRGYQNGFQSRNKTLSKRLKAVVKENGKHDDFIVCIQDAINDYSIYNDDAQEFYTYYYLQNRQECVRLLNTDYDYYNTQVTRPYMDFKKKNKCAEWFEKIKRIWEGQDVLIVEGVFSRLGVNNGLFDNVKSLHRILAPAENAFDKYDNILNATINYGKDKLVLIALGQTATVLAYDLYKAGLWALDIGHIDIEYEWFMKQAKHKVKIEGKYINEINQRKIGEIDDPIYCKQIICKIL